MRERRIITKYQFPNEVPENSGTSPETAYQLTPSREVATNTFVFWGTESAPEATNRPPPYAISLNGNVAAVGRSVQTLPLLEIRTLLVPGPTAANWPLPKTMSYKVLIVPEFSAFQSMPFWELKMVPPAPTMTNRPFPYAMP